VLLKKPAGREIGRFFYVWYQDGDDRQA